MFASQSLQSAGIAPRMGVQPNGEPQGYNLSFDLPLREARDAFERMYIEHHLGREGGSMTRVAEKTGLERTHLYRKLKQLGVEPGKLAKKGG
jgi:DNA-binding NtrC family response regulator